MAGSTVSAAKRRWRTVAGVGGSFFGLTALIVSLGITAVVPPPTVLLLFVTLLGLYVGCGVLVAVYRLVERLE